MNKLLFLILAVFFVATACDDGSLDGTNPPPGMDADSDVDGDADGDSDGDADGDADVQNPCGGTLPVIVRDFEPTHADFYPAGSVTCWTTTLGLVNGTLGPDSKPTFAAATGPLLDATAICDAGFNMLSTADNFRQWYNTTPGVNTEHAVNLELTEVSPGEFVYENLDFYPLGAGNYHFTTEIHTLFEYQPGQEFYFYGDDDVWIYVNGQLALDLGGIHTQEEGTIYMDQLGLTVGNQYSLDIFQAERQPTWSNFKISTSINCFMPPIE